MRNNVILWVVQALLAALFLFAGGMKLVMPIEAMAGPVALPGPFLRFLGAAEVLGAVGLILPWAFGVQRWLTPVAAAGLATIMVGATTITAATMGAAAAALPLTVGVLCSTVVYGRTDRRQRVLAFGSGRARAQSLAN